MLILHSMPAVNSVVLSASAWAIAGDNGMACVDGRPTRKSRFLWPAGAPSLAQAVTLTLTFATASRLRGFAALGLSIPAGVRIDFLGPAGQGLGGTTDTDRTRLMPDGSVGLFAVAEDTGIEDTGCQVRIYNDCNGATWAVAGTAVDIGEIFAGDGVEIEHGLDWGCDLEDPSEVSRTRASQLNTVRRSPYRIYDNMQLIAIGAAEVRHGGLDHGQDWATTRRVLFGNARCVAIPRWKVVGGIDAEALNATAVYGTGRLGSERHVGGDQYVGSARFEEVPAR